MCEYLGELISISESNRRGIFADIEESNYLYTLDDNRNIDAKGTGSLMKFVNNSFFEMVNCKARILEVKGSKRVALYASRTIEKGEELYFSYGYSEETRTKINWMKGFIDKYFFMNNENEL